MTNNEDDEDYDIYDYEIGIIKNDIQDYVHTTSDLKHAEFLYNKFVEQYSKPNEINHYIVYLYSYDKTTNINYFDNVTEIC